MWFLQTVLLCTNQHFAFFMTFDRIYLYDLKKVRIVVFLMSDHLIVKQQAYDRLRVRGEGGEEKQKRQTTIDA